MVVSNGWPQRLIRRLLTLPGAAGVIHGRCRRMAVTRWLFVRPMDPERFRRRSSKQDPAPDGATGRHEIFVTVA